MQFAQFVLKHPISNVHPDVQTLVDLKIVLPCNLSNLDFFAYLLVSYSLQDTGVTVGINKYKEWTKNNEGFNLNDDTW